MTPWSLASTFWKANICQMMKAWLMRDWRITLDQKKARKSFHFYLKEREWNQLYSFTDKNMDILAKSAVINNDLNFCLLSQFLSNNPYFSILFFNIRLVEVFWQHQLLQKLLSFSNFIIHQFILTLFPTKTTFCKWNFLSTVFFIIEHLHGFFNLHKNIHILRYLHHFLCFGSAVNGYYLIPELLFE